MRISGRGRGGSGHEDLIAIKVPHQQIFDRRSGEDLSDLEFPHLEEIVLSGGGVALVI
jgi:hypothetical protein